MNKTVEKRFSRKRKPNIGPSVELAAHLQFVPVYPELFEEALTHSSYANEHKILDNERLEFLGDSVLSLITASFLFKTYPDFNEGNMAKLKSIIVSTKILASFSKQLQLDNYVKLGSGELRHSGKTKPSILEDVFEAFIGAYFLNFGFEQTTRLIEPLIKDNLAEIHRQFDLMNAKNELQELLQSRGLFPQYHTVKEEGPSHQRRFTVEVLVGNRLMGQGEGNSLKEAQNGAALEALAKLNEKNR